jgi:hypothetical protein
VGWAGGRDAAGAARLSPSLLALTKLDPDRQIVHRLKPLVRELEQEARLADAWRREAEGR